MYSENSNRKKNITVKQNITVKHVPYDCWWCMDQIGRERKRYNNVAWCGAASLLIPWERSVTSSKLDQTKTVLTLGQPSLQGRNCCSRDSTFLQGTKLFASLSRLVICEIGWLAALYDVTGPIWTAEVPGFDIFLWRFWFIPLQPQLQAFSPHEGAPISHSSGRTAGSVCRASLARNWARLASKWNNSGTF